MKITIHPLSDLPNQPAGIVPDEQLIQRLESSFRIFARRDLELATHFYQRLFAKHPELRPMFPADMTRQKGKLMDTLSLVFENLRSPKNVCTKLQRLGASHIDYGTRPEHYPIVTEALVAAMADLAGSDWSLEMHADWTCAMRLVSNVMQSGTNANDAKP